MSKKMPNDPFQAIEAVDLAQVSGGRLIPNKGPDASVIQGIQLLIKTLGEVGQQITANGQQQSQQMMGMMQQMMQRRAGG